MTNLRGMFIVLVREEGLRLWDRDKDRGTIIRTMDNPRPRDTRGLTLMKFGRESIQTSQGSLKPTGKDKFLGFGCGF